MKMTKLSRRVIMGVHVTFFKYGRHEWSYTIYGPRETQEMIARRKPYLECLRDVKQLIKLYHQ
jgi:hypothetical protein